LAPTLPGRACGAVVRGGGAGGHAGRWPGLLVAGRICTVPAPYDAYLLLDLLGIEVTGEGADATGRLTVTHPLVAGTGFLWTPVVIAIADALCAFGVSHHWPHGAVSFTTMDCTTNFLSGAKEGEVVIGQASPLHLGRTTQVWDAVVTNETTEREIAAYRCTQLFSYD
jgi:1,4-dihydroxy-2-naphthoyl-CoA hydrolase